MIIESDPKARIENENSAIFIVQSSKFRIQEMYLYDSSLILLLLIMTRKALLLLFQCVQQSYKPLCQPDPPKKFSAFYNVPVWGPQGYTSH